MAELEIGGSDQFPAAQVVRLFLQVTFDPQHQRFERQFIWRRRHTRGKGLTRQAGRSLVEINTEREHRQAKHQCDRNGLAPARIGGGHAALGLACLVSREKAARYFDTRGGGFRLAYNAALKVAGNLGELVAIKRDLAFARIGAHPTPPPHQWTEQGQKREARETEKKQNVIRGEQQERAFRQARRGGARRRETALV